MLHGKHADCAVMKAAPIARNFREQGSAHSTTKSTCDDNIITSLHY